MAAEESFEKAKRLLLGALDTVLHAATHLRANDNGAGDGPSSTPRPSAHRPIVRDSEMSSPYSSQSETSTTQKTFTGCTSKDVSVGSVGLQEHRCLFKFQPSKATIRACSRRNVTLKAKRGKRGPSTWKKECICLSSCDQLSIPSTEDRMVLAKMGLGLKELLFDVDDGPVEIHTLFLAEYPLLEAAGGYSLLRLAGNSHDLVEIEKHLVGSNCTLSQGHSSAGQAVHPPSAE